MPFSSFVLDGSYNFKLHHFTLRLVDKLFVPVMKAEKIWLILVSIVLSYSKKGISLSQFCGISPQSPENNTYFIWNLHSALQF